MGCHCTPVVQPANAQLAMQCTQLLVPGLMLQYEC